MSWRLQSIYHLFTIMQVLHLIIHMDEQLHMDELRSLHSHESLISFIAGFFGAASSVSWKTLFLMNQFVVATFRVVFWYAKDKKDMPHRRKIPVISEESLWTISFFSTTREHFPPADNDSRVSRRDVVGILVQEYVGRLPSHIQEILDCFICGRIMLQIICVFASLASEWKWCKEGRVKRGGGKEREKIHGKKTIHGRI